ncbi:hypothetical protein GIB67_039035 [Kingdonia uniflora]|uniref:Transposase n=1 Tax=Kingdonia uniflora TaxID=39325 RepID=A0A7J7LL16_9MAGN|nr:hypothetical protein GIB67_039035 [Kingdonia uniflora]
MGDMNVSQVMGDVTVGSGYVSENVISKKKARATKIDKRKNTETNGQNQPSVMKKKILRPSELPEEELDYLPLFYVSDDDDNMACDNVEVVGEVPIWEEGFVENEWYDNTCIENEWYDNTCIENEWHDNDMDEDNVDEGGHDDDMGGDDANMGGDNDDEGGHDVDMGWDIDDIETQVNEWIHFAQLNVDSLDAEEGYYSTHSSQDGDGIPNEEDLRKSEVFGDFLNGANNIFEEEEDVFKLQPQTDCESLYVGMEWPTISEAREYLRKFVILNKFETKQVKNESYRHRYKCAVPKCKWLVYARKSYDGHNMVLMGCHFEHTYTGKVGSENKLANALWIVNEIEELVRDVKTLTPNDVQTIIRRKYGVNISYYTAWNAKTIYIEMITGSFDDGYNRLPKLTRKVFSSNPGSIATWSFQAVLGLDGYLLKGKYGGQCLSIVALDRNNRLFPIVIYLCRSKYYKTWHTFRTTLASHLTRHQSKLTFISDKQKGLIESIAEVFPYKNHRFCFRHMWKNFKKKFRGSHLERLCWGAVKAFVKADKQVFLDKLQVDNPEAKRWLDKKPAEYWYRYCSEYHMISCYVKTYSGSVLAISDPSFWDKTVNI